MEKQKEDNLLKNIAQLGKSII